MHVTEDPVVEECSSSEKRGGDYVRITFRPDFERFGMMDGLDDDAVGLISKRAYDVSLSPGSAPPILLQPCAHLYL
jgi:DNA topoisomerase-2